MKTAEMVDGNTSLDINSEIEVEKVVDWYSRLTQFISWPFIYVTTKIFLKTNVIGLNNFKNVRSPFIIIANHISFYDSFLFRIALGFWTPHLPLRFMAVEKFDWKILNILESIGIIKLLYLLFGVFTVVPGKGIEENLKKPVNIIKSGGNVVIYPEGKIVINKEIGPFKNGAAVLHRKTGVAVLPVYFKHTKGTGFRGVVDIVVGGPINILENMTDDQVTQSFRSAVVRLKESIL